MTWIQNSIMKFASNEELFGYRSDSQFMVWMKPSEFLEKAPKINSKHETSFEKRTIVDNLANKMKKDQPIDPLFLDVDTVNCKVIHHEGRHRALAAEQIGISRVPVIVYLKNDQGDYISLKEYMKKVTADKTVVQCNFLDAKTEE